MANDPDELEEIEGRLRALEGTIETLIEVLAGREVLTEAHKRLFAKIADRKSRRERPMVKLRVYDGDKYEVSGPEVDCAALMPICRARCCTLEVRLTRQDVEEGELSWNVEQPYVLRKAEDNHCMYLGDNGACTTYHNRPIVCRTYDCRDDSRIWQDFEKKIPMPFPFVRDYEPPAE
jgi:Fe-S-cluster containining protein